ncbi:hypothetical protein XcodCFBP4690_20625 [Xanthomonas codiaei]|uniref:Uncharacterized protein n=1 Tax=Xanthomonas codiaei TaxID=56463 RepID=A0A2S7C8C4_9XANT|nr:hypothetical protein XcodCFBP4690_20625 [Xanthomonas codiaei]
MSLLLLLVAWAPWPDNQACCFSEFSILRTVWRRSRHARNDGLKRIPQQKRILQDRRIANLGVGVVEGLEHGGLPVTPNYYWTAEMRCCTEYLRSLGLCEWGKA